MHVPESVNIINNCKSETRFIFKFGLGVESNWQEEKIAGIEGTLYFKDNAFVYKFPITKNKNNYRTVDFLVKSIDNKPNTKSKHKYGEYGHVLLSDEEVQKLQERFPDWQDKIRELDEGIELKGYKYKSHYLAILKWAKTDKPKKQSEYDKFMGELQSMYDDEVRYGE